MMKWNNIRRRGSVGSTDEESEDIRRSIEALDKVLDEFDDLAPKNPKVRKKRNGPDSSLNNSISEKCETKRICPSSFATPERQSLDILDTVLALYEDELNHDTKDNAVSSGFEGICDEPTELERLRVAGDDAEREESNDNLASPSSKRGKKILPPPVPKRSPTTCLSCSSSFEYPSPETDKYPRDRNPFFSESSVPVRCQCESECSGHSKSSGKKGKLFRSTIKKGSVRPKVKANYDSTTSQDDLSDEDVFYNCSGELNALNDGNSNSVTSNNNSTAKMLEVAKIRVKEPLATDSASKIDIDQMRNEESIALPFNLKEKFALAKYLLKTGQLRGLDEEPPSFKPPPIPLPPKTKINKGKIVGLDVNVSQVQNANARKDSNGNDVPKGTAVSSKNREILIGSESIQNESQSQHHVTSVKITQNSHMQHSNVSVITIQPKTPPISKDANAAKPSFPPKENQPKVALTTFTRSPANNNNNNNSKSSSLEDVFSSNSKTNNAVMAADMAGMTKTGSLPLELKKPAAPMGGAVFFNVFQCPEGEKSLEDKNNDNNKPKVEEKDSDKRQGGWKKKKKSKDKQPKDSTNTSTESIKANVEQNALLAELTGKIQIKKSATPNGSSSDDSDQGSNQTGEQVEKAQNVKEDKGIFKGFWSKKKPTPEN